MAELHTFALAAADNNNSPPDGLPENMNYSAVNNTGREIMAALRRAYSDMNGSLVTAGTGAAYTVTPNATYTALFDGLTLTFRAHTASTGPATLSVGGLAPTTIVDIEGNTLAAGSIPGDARVRVVYDATNTVFIAMNTVAGLGDFAVGGALTVGTTLDVTGLATITGGVSIPDVIASVDLVNAFAPLLVGVGTDQHLELDGDDVQSKSNATTAATLRLNRLGGNVVVGESNVDGAGLSDATAPLIVGPETGVHLEFDGAEVMAKATDTTSNTFSVNRLGGAVTIGGASANGDVITLRNQRTLVEGSEGEPLRIQNTTDGGNAIGGTQDVNIQFENSNDEALGGIGWPASANMFVTNMNNGGGVILRANDAGGTSRFILNGDPDGACDIRYAGIPAVRTVDEAANTNVTSAEVVHRNGTTYPVGLSNWPLRAGTAVSSTITLDESDVGTMLLQLSNNGTITFPNDANIRVGSFGLILNNSTTNLTLNASGTNLLRLQGDGSSPGNAASLSIGGWCFWWKRSDTIFYVGGAGINV